MDRLHETATILTTLNRISLSWRFSFAKISIFFENSYSCCLFFLEFLLLNRTFDLTVLGRLHLGIKRKNLFFLCTSLGLHYLCNAKQIKQNIANEKTTKNCLYLCTGRL